MPAVWPILRSTLRKLLHLELIGLLAGVGAGAEQAELVAEIDALAGGLADLAQHAQEALHLEDSIGLLARRRGRH